MWERSTLVELSPRTGVCTAVQPPRDGQTHGRAKVGEGWRYGPTDTLIGHFLFEPLNVFFCWSGIFQTNDKNPAMFQQVYLPRSILCFERYVIRYFDYSSIYSSIQDKKLVFNQSDSTTLIVQIDRSMAKKCLNLNRETSSSHRTGHISTPNH
jgi:hypothetical protein